MSRNAFYNSLGYKVVWLFDFMEQYNSDRISPINEMCTEYKWRVPRKTFNTLKDLKNKNIVLYFQFAVWSDGFDFEDPKDECHSEWISHVSRISAFGFERFAVDNTYSKNGFLNIFRRFLREKVYISKEEAYDRLVIEGHKDHTTYYSPCPLSITGKCCDSTIDVPESEFPNIRVVINNC